MLPTVLCFTVNSYYKNPSCVTLDYSLVTYLYYCVDLSPRTCLLDVRKDVIFVITSLCRYVCFVLQKQKVINKPYNFFILSYDILLLCKADPHQLRSVTKSHTLSIPISLKRRFFARAAGTVQTR